MEPVADVDPADADVEEPVELSGLACRRAYLALRSGVLDELRNGRQERGCRGVDGR
ncbi:hypothetical protein [Blastococcus brunescens]|uniref:Uncharacterized protein n=1 Tax=Blastococcus brunescens TaxID=1564165 RepID=A0ABZ1AUH5_9ACTN|nr:hypothetical protein [Blastococcus sp. BMG 8361]WRL62212.1 hypothetical protein U6N30_19475 [Blastococcus sp. BMG 8361]